MRARSNLRVPPGIYLAVGATLAVSAMTMLAAGWAPPAIASTGAKTALSPDRALAQLIEGNRRYSADQAPPLSGNRERREEIAKSQAPFAVLVGCSDSRVPPEVLFGRGLGDLFVVRVAGNTIDDTGLGSIEYAVAELGVPLIVVLGHERCGAVGAAVAVVEGKADPTGAIAAMVEPILPAALRARSLPGDWVDNAVRENVIREVGKLRSAGKLIPDAVAAGKLKIVGARYDLDDGLVDFFLR